MKQRKNIIIFGSGGHSKVIVDTIEKEEKFQLVGFIDDNKNENILDYKVIGNDDSLTSLIQEKKIFGGIIGIGDNAIRKKLSEKIISVIPDFHFVNCIHPEAIIGKNVVFGFGNVVMAGAIINTSSKIENHCILNTGCSVEHDCEISDFSSIGPGATLGGSVKIGKYSAIGLGATILPNVKIGSNCIVGAGSLVCKNARKNSVYYDSPSKFIRPHSLGDKYL
jgi:sugar O-acyltransferase (sialic acid O-acetyltransferase NeuD family)